MPRFILQPVLGASYGQVSDSFTNHIKNFAKKFNAKKNNGTYSMPNPVYSDMLPTKITKISRAKLMKELDDLMERESGVKTLKFFDNNMHVMSRFFEKFYTFAMHEGHEIESIIPERNQKSGEDYTILKINIEVEYEGVSDDAHYIVFKNSHDAQMYAWNYFDINDWGGIEELVSMGWISQQQLLTCVRVDGVAFDNYAEDSCWEKVHDELEEVLDFLLAGHWLSDERYQEIFKRWVENEEMSYEQMPRELEQELFDLYREHFYAEYELDQLRSDPFDYLINGISWYEDINGVIENCKFISFNWDKFYSIILEKNYALILSSYDNIVHDVNGYEVVRMY